MLAMQFADIIFPFLIGAIYGWAIGLIPLAFPGNSRRSHLGTQAGMALLAGAVFYRFVGFSAVFGMLTLLVWLQLAFASIDRRMTASKRKVVLS